MRPFRYIFDPMFVASLVVYALNRFALRPRLSTPFLHQHLNDLLCIPFWLPIMLFVQRKLGLRGAGDVPPRGGEIVIALMWWSWMFELWLPNTDLCREWCIADPWDVMYYSVGALIA